MWHLKIRDDYSHVGKIEDKLMTIDCPEKWLLFAVVARAIFDYGKSSRAKKRKLRRDTLRQEAERYLFRDDSTEACSLRFISDYLSPNPPAFISEMRRIARDFAARAAADQDLRLHVVKNKLDPLDYTF